MQAGRNRFASLFHNVVPTLIVINVGVWLLWQFALSSDLQRFMAANFTVSWSGVASGRIWTLLTAAFSQSEIMHIFFNMWILYVFGKTMEEAWGSRRFLSFYLVTAVVSSLLAVLMNQFVMGQDNAGLGASGVVSGVMLAFGLAYPRHTILLFFVLPVPALYASLGFVALDVIGFVQTSMHYKYGVGHGAHLAGALCGVLFHFYLIGKIQIPGLRLGGGRKRRRRRSSEHRARIDVLPGIRNDYHSRDPDEERMDQLLDKIKRGGLDSLSPEERDFMMKMSQRLRRDP